MITKEQAISWLKICEQNVCDKNINEIIKNGNDFSIVTFKEHKKLNGFHFIYPGIYLHFKTKDIWIQDTNFGIFDIYKVGQPSCFFSGFYAVPINPQLDFYSKEKYNTDPEYYIYYKNHPHINSLSLCIGEGLYMAIDALKINDFITFRDIINSMLETEDKEYDLWLTGEDYEDEDEDEEDEDEEEEDEE